MLDFSLASVVSHCASDNWTNVRARELPTFYDSYTNLKQLHIYFIQLYKAQWFYTGWHKLLTAEDTHVFKIYMVHCMHMSICSSNSYYPMYAVLKLWNNTTTWPDYKFSKHQLKLVITRKYQNNILRGPTCHVVMQHLSVSSLPCTDGNYMYQYRCNVCSSISYICRWWIKDDHTWKSWGLFDNLCLAVLLLLRFFLPKELKKNSYFWLLEIDLHLTIIYKSVIKTT